MDAKKFEADSLEARDAFRKLACKLQCQYQQILWIRKWIYNLNDIDATCKELIFLSNSCGNSELATKGYESTQKIRAVLKLSTPSL
jgi:hypothetical protein